jgi:Uncharacterized conserved protein
MRASLLTPSEAAIVAGVTVRDINRVIDEKILPEGFTSVEDGRRVRLAACPLVGFYFRTARELTAETRIALIHRFSERITLNMAEHPFTSWRKADWTVREGFLTVTLNDFVVEADDRIARLEAARELVVEEPDILGGTPVIRGTRIPVYDVVASVSAGLPRDRILAAWPGLSDDAIDLAMLYAEANPVRGRPAASPPCPPMRPSSASAPYRGAAGHETADRRVLERGTRQARP